MAIERLCEILSEDRSDEIAELRNSVSVANGVIRADSSDSLDSRFQRSTPLPTQTPYPASSFNTCRAMTIRWISDVPSPISQIFASRIIRSTG